MATKPRLTYRPGRERDIFDWNRLFYAENGLGYVEQVGNV